MLISSHAIQQNESVIYLDLDGRFDSGFLEKRGVDSSRFHLFQPAPDQVKATLLGLDAWLHQHTDEHVTWLIVDGAADVRSLKECQRKWAFVLLTASRSLQQEYKWWNYRFQLTRNEREVQMRLIAPLIGNTFTVNAIDA
ncbi:hypothetical protein EC973_004989 [Apophysomyces ossiformis]|uniref:Uncharacterized protein n=1 Tax=Apophysomyces ossiformis TaxID=679940 RepID=A0A8H7BFC5_9FUNG|nr:hypothetical protein EC973_004989 [Apophysomyces ossiformis]